MSQQEFMNIGTRVPMTDGPPKVTGQAIYADDLRLPNMLYGKILRSPHAHARIISINTSKAERLPGVMGVVTGKDAPAKYGILPIGHDETAFSIDRVRYVGDEVAAVCATSEQIAEEALELIEVEYEILPAFVTPEEAMGCEDESLWLHHDRKRNIEKQYHHHFGDVEKGFQEALDSGGAVRFDKYYNPRVTHVPMEPHACVANWEHEGKVTLWTSTQTPHYVHRTLAVVLDMPMSSIRVIKPFVGGGFGGKSETFTHEVAACLLAKKTCRPVKFNFTREEVFYAHRGRPEQYVELKTGVAKDGRITAVEAKVVQDGGAYCSYGVVTILYSGALIAALYDIPNIKFDGYRVLTNKPACGPMRGHGTVGVRFGFESQLDMLAAEIGMDAGELRLKNKLKPNTITVNDLRVTSYGYDKCIEKVMEASDWRNKRSKMPYGKGVGMAGSHYVSGAANSIIRSKLPHSTVSIKIDYDGGVTVYTGAAEIGQGTETIHAQIVAEEMGIELSRIRIVAADSALTPVDLGSYSSRVTFMAGNAAKEAARDIKMQLFRAAAELLGESPEHLVARDEKIFPRDEPHRSITYQEALLACIEQGGTLIAKGTYTPPPESQGGSFRGAGVGPGVAYSYAAQVAEVTVDPETGLFTVDKIWAAHDCGRALNLLTVEGQVEGSVWMGLGQAVAEEQIFENGKTMNPGLLEYKSASSLESPPIETFIVETIDPEGPFGAKEAGEGSLAATIPAVANAIYDAIGVRINDLPLSPERILKAIEEQKKRS
ncbi:MAG: 4-hydroxybenzoyl-CoA reductase subunit alpha [Pyrinomonadaceae bacterium]|nr:4-hydroxybenzoyl-CoA reductase subunit alpha [Pyrinomonadaceae bacterium]